MKSLCTLALALACVLASVPAAQADTYTGPRNGYRWDYQTASYVKIVFIELLPVAFPVPSQLIVNLAPGTAPPPVTVAPAAYAHLRQKEADTARRLESIEKTQRLLLERLERGPGPAPGTLGPSGAPKVKRDLPPPVPGLVGTQQPANQALAGEQLVVAAAQVMKLHCAQCHSGDKSRGEAQIFDAAGAFDLSGTDPEAIVAQTRSDKMPKGPVKLAPAEKEILKQWARSLKAQE